MEGQTLQRQCARGLRWVHPRVLPRVGWKELREREREIERDLL
jgi:hypothetical protein